MIVFIGIPAVIFLTVIAVVLIYPCKRNPKVQNFGLKLKDKIVFDTVIQVMIISSLSFAVEAGFGRALNNEIDQPEIGVFQMVLIILLLGFTFFFAIFVDKLEKDQFDQFKTTY
jgi:hypothetical protein